MVAMKKALITLAILGAYAGAASAQSSLTIFGVVDVNVRYLENGDVDQTQLATDGNSSSRLGFRGIEDLGNGLRAGFWLESAFAADTGNINSSGKFWHRRATVSLFSPYGELRLGRDTVPTWTAFVDSDVFGTVGIGDASRTFNALGGADTKIRSDNLVALHLPSTLGGIYGAFAAAPGEGVSGRKYFGGRLGYRAGPIDVSGAYGQTEITEGAIIGDYKIALISGSYDFGIAKVVASVQTTELEEQEAEHYTIGTSVPLPVGTLKASYSKAEGKNALEEQDADHYALGYVYDLSKRTALYGTYAVTDNKDGANFTVGAISGVTLPAGEKSTGFEIGLRHSF
jgi:predicted porin